MEIAEITLADLRAIASEHWLDPDEVIRALHQLADSGTAGIKLVQRAPAQSRREQPPAQAPADVTVVFPRPVIDRPALPPSWRFFIVFFVTASAVSMCYIWLNNIFDAPGQQAACLLGFLIAQLICLALAVRAIGKEQLEIAVKLITNLIRRNLNHSAPRTRAVSGQELRRHLGRFGRFVSRLLHLPPRRPQTPTTTTSRS
jgi:hypothetical protein